MKPVTHSTSKFITWLKARLAWHPVLFAIAPVISLIGHNLMEIHPSTGLRPLLLLVVLTMSAMLLMYRWLKDNQRSAMLISLFLLLFFSYGHVYYGLVAESAHGLFSRIGLIGNHLALGLTWTLLYLAGVWVVMRATTRLSTVTQLMNVMAVVTVLIPLIQIVRFELQRSQPAWTAPQAQSEKTLASAGDKPDIYYLVLDGYGRADILQDLYAFDNSSFLRFLEQEGFTIIHSARSNYVQTSLSIAASMNMEYIPALIGSDPDGGDARLALSRFIRDNRVVSDLSQQGYQTVTFATGYRPTELRGSDRFLSPAGVSINPLEGLLLETSAFTALESLGRSLGLPAYYPGYASHRELILFTLERLPRVAALPGPKFVFVHVVIPHPPFVFTASGAPAASNSRFSFMDGDAFQGTRQDYLEGYRQQLEFLNTQLTAVIPDIVQNTRRPSILILQGDHGPGSQLDYQEMEATNLNERTAILFAMRFPEGMEADPPDTLTPVNAFRYIYTHLDAQASIPLLPDRSYYSTWNSPLNFQEITTTDLE